MLEQLVEGHKRAHRRLERQQLLVQSPTNTRQDPGDANNVSVFVERLDELARRRAELLDRLRPKGKEVTT